MLATFRIYCGLADTGDFVIAVADSQCVVVFDGLTFAACLAGTFGVAYLPTVICPCLITAVLVVYTVGLSGYVIMFFNLRRGAGRALFVIIQSTQ